MAKHEQLPLLEARIIGENMVDALGVACDRIEIAGSIRRGRPLVHDVDLVVIPKGEWLKNKDGELEPFPNRNLWFDIPRLIKDVGGTIASKGPQIITAVVDGFQIDINRATPDTWGIVYLIKTGPKELNIELCNRARKLGKQLKPWSGVWQADTRFPAFNELDIFGSLELAYIDPNGRDESVHRLHSGAML